MTVNNGRDEEWLRDLYATNDIIQFGVERLRADRCKKVSNIANEVILNGQEAKLLKYFARICYLKIVNQNSDRTLGSLDAWLAVVNIDSADAKALTKQLPNLIALLQMTRVGLDDLCKRLQIKGESRRRLLAATESLRSYTNRWLRDGVEPTEHFVDSSLAWMGYDRSDTDRRSVSESGLDSGASDSGIGSNVSQTSLPTSTPPASPAMLLSPTAYIARSSHHTTTTTTTTSSAGASKCGKASSSTPPPTLKWSIGVKHNHQPSSSSSTVASTSSMMRSHSHESNLEHRIRGDNSGKLLTPQPISTSRSIGDNLAVTQTDRNKLASSARDNNSDTGTTLSSSLTSSGGRGGGGYSLHPDANFGAPPKSPKTGRMLHSIPHVWHRRALFRNLTDPCQICQRPLGLTSEKCKSCKLKVHTVCKSKIGSTTCGLTPGHLKEMFTQMFANNVDPSWNMPDSASHHHMPSSHSDSGPAFHYLEQLDSSSSTNSSAPSTPALLTAPPVMPTASPFAGGGKSQEHRKFTFPDLPEVPDIVLTENGEEQCNLEESQGSDYTLRSGGNLAGSQNTLLTDSIGSGSGGGQEVDNNNITGGGHKWDRNSWSMGTIRGPSASSWVDVTIPVNKISFAKQSLIGRGRFGEVHKGMYFGDVAVKFLNMDHVDEAKQLDAFKQEVVSFKNTRHENIVLFLGYCMDHQKLGIVMNYCKGRPLHALLHQSRDRLSFANVAQYATQICQGVSYLHTKKILHKDLRTKNVFIENNNKVVITDFGLFSMRRLCRDSDCKSLYVPEFWLCYLAPELVRGLSCQPTAVQLPFSEKTDVYSFGTIWFELLTGEFPFRRFHPDTIVWQVGKGIKPALNNLHAAREIKDILIKCWAYLDADRPDMNQMSKLLERLPKKRLVRSPSHPVHLSKSHESMF